MTKSKIQSSLTEQVPTPMKIRIEESMVLVINVVIITSVRFVHFVMLNTEFVIRLATLQQFVIEKTRPKPLQSIWIMKVYLMIITQLYHFLHLVNIFEIQSSSTTITGVSGHKLKVVIEVNAPVTDENNSKPVVIRLIITQHGPTVLCLDGLRALQVEVVLIKHYCQ